ncbi:MAG: hypothetical protein ACTTIO_04350 [Candidatus Fimenecus sp.]
MKIIEAIDKINSLKPNSYTQAEKIKWLSNLDCAIKKEILEHYVENEHNDFKGYTENISTDTELLVPNPYDDIYIKYLEAQIDYYNGEYARYNNAIATYNTIYSMYRNFYNSTHTAYSVKFTYF